MTFLLTPLPPMETGLRADRLRARLGGAGCDALLVTRLVNIRYLTGFTGSAALLLVRADDLVFVTDGRYGEQSAAEATLIEAVHRARGRCDAIVINAAALSHYGWSLHDALAAFDGIVVELHLSNPNAREPWRSISVVAPVATGSIVGFRGHGYALAVDAVARLLK